MAQNSNRRQNCMRPNSDLICQHCQVSCLSGRQWAIGNGTRGKMDSAEAKAQAELGGSGRRKAGTKLDHTMNGKKKREKKER